MPAFSGLGLLLHRLSTTTSGVHNRFSPLERCRGHKRFIVTSCASLQTEFVSGSIPVSTDFCRTGTTNKLLKVGFDQGSSTPYPSAL